MAQVPSVTGPQVAANGAPTPYQRDASRPDAFGAGIAQGLGGVASSVGDLATVMENHTKVLQGLANKAAADDATINAAQNINTMYTDYVVNQRGQNALPALQPTMEKMEEARKAAGGSLNNPVAREMFDSDSRRTLLNLTGQMARHAATEQNTYVRNTSIGKVQSGWDLAAAHPGDPTFQDQALETTRQEMTYLGHMDGQDQGMIDHKVQEYQSAGLESIVKQKLQTDPLGAKAYFDSIRGKLLPGIAATLEQQIKSGSAPYKAASIADKYGAFDFDHAVGPQGASTVWREFIAPHEGGYAAHDANGAPVNRGFNQSANPDIDVKNLTAEGAEQRFIDKYWKPSGAEDLSPALAPIHADTYFINPKKAQQFLKASGGDPDRYMNLREAWMQDLEAKDPDRYGKYKKAWDRRNEDLRSFAPNYFAAGSEGTAVKTDSEKAMAILAARPERLAALDQDINANYGGDPVMKAQAEQRLDSTVSRQYSAYMASAKASTDAMIGAIDGGEANGPKPTDLASLLKSYPNAQRDWANMTQAQQHSITNMLTRNAHPTLNSEGALAAWQTLDGERLTNPEKFASRQALTDPLFQSLPVGEQRAFMGQQDQINAGTRIPAEQRHALDIAKPFLKDAEIDATSEDYSKFMSSLNNNIKTYFDINKKSPNDEQVRLMTQNLLMSRGGWLSKKRGFEDPANAGLVPGVPDSFTAAVVAEARSRGKVATNQIIHQLYEKKVTSSGR